MKKVEYISSEQIDRALNAEYRQYLAGKISRPQPHLPCIEDDIEIGMSKYDVFTADKPHMHPIATEHGYVLEGSVKVLLLEDGTEYCFKKGDLFVVQPQVAYAGKNASGTKVIFVKSPGGNDKVLVEYDASVEMWLRSWE